MTEYVNSPFEVSSSDLRVPTPGGSRGTAVPAAPGVVAGRARRQRHAVLMGALIPNPPVSGLLPVRRQVLTS
ncbi:hypothetical protein [Quadrisphaera sp. KR29]|uniref:hypothetical protein n=1 Tax=Quadrisphaera sp. KR29 TaxID=3461391 RepID=UPI0040449714